MLKDKFGTPEQGVYVLNSEDPNFTSDLTKCAKHINATCVFECVSGPMVGIIANCLPKKSTIFVYGQLSEQKIEGIDAMTVLSKNLRIEGFLLS